MTGQPTMFQTWRSRLLHYGIAAAATLLATLLRAALDPVLGDHAPFATYYVAVLFTAWCGGLGPSLLAIVAGGLAGDYFFAAPRGSLMIYDGGGTDVEHRVSLALFIAVGIFAAFVCDSLARDVVRRKRAEAALRESQEKLQRHEAELAHVARLSMMGEMAASLAHELNQPLHAVRNYARGSVRRLLKEPRHDKELLAALEEIGEEANRAAEIIRRVRGFVQKRDPQVSELSLNSLMEDVISLSTPEIERRHAHVVLELAADLPAVRADRIQIEQVAMNLIRNGLESMDEVPAPRRRLTVQTLRRDADTVEVRIRDGGKGISPDDARRIFEPFFTTKSEGMGMGLPISRSIVQAHGGALGLSSSDERGSTFYFTLPIGSEDIGR
jgi:C4-dicarboxylate-specific signal transduction histidine kinase